MKAALEPNLCSCEWAGWLRLQSLGSIGNETGGAAVRGYGSKMAQLLWQPAVCVFLLNELPNNLNQCHHNILLAIYQETFELSEVVLIEHALLSVTGKITAAQLWGQLITPTSQRNTGLQRHSGKTMLFTDNSQHWIPNNIAVVEGQELLAKEALHHACSLVIAWSKRASRMSFKTVRQNELHSCPRQKQRTKKRTKPH